MAEKLKKFKYPLLALVLGLLIMLVPIGGGSEETAVSDEERLASALEKCEGVGSVTALLSEKGAVIVCDGADSAEVRLNVMNAAEAFTGFPSDRIQVIKTAPNIGG